MIKLACSLFIMSHFALQWLRILEVVPYDSRSSGLLTYFFIGAVVLTAFDLLGTAMNRERARINEAKLQ